MLSWLVLVCEFHCEVLTSQEVWLDQNAVQIIISKSELQCTKVQTTQNRKRSQIEERELKGCRVDNFIILYSVYSMIFNRKINQVSSQIP